MKKNPEFTIVIPAYNEEKVIRKSLEKITSYLTKTHISWEIVVSDDGSSDRTSNIVNDMANKNINVVRSKENRGKGNALKKGILKAKGRYIIFMDADLSVPISNIKIFIKTFRCGSDVVIASRRVQGAKIAVHQPWHREKMGRVFTFLTRIITGVPLADFTCGFKGFSSKAAHKIFRSSVIDRWSYDAEIMFLAKKYGYKIYEVPITWKNRSDTRVRLKSVILESFFDLIKIRMNDLFGLYDLH